MNSLRFRLIVGSSLIAVVPLASAIVLLSQHMEATEHTHAAARLDAALGGLRTQLARDGETTAERLRILARDPQLRRLYLVRPADGVELAEFLAERRFLLGLDLLQISDTTGVTVAVGATATSNLAPDARDPSRLESSGRRVPEAITMERVAGDSALALVARAPIRYADRSVGVLEGGVLLDPGYLRRLRETSGIDLVLSEATGRAVTTTRGELLEVVVQRSRGQSPGVVTERVSQTGESYLARTIPLPIGPPPYPWISGFVSTASSDRTIAVLQGTATMLGLLGLALAILLALLWSSQVSRPVERLATFANRLARGEWDEPLALDSVRELRTLVAALDRMRTDLRSQRERLVTSERQAAWGQMAREVAHEVRNPLTPIAVSIADLKRSYDLGRPDFPRILDQAVHTIGEEVETLKRLLQEFADFGRLPPPSFAPCRITSLFADLGTLYAREIAEGRCSVLRPEREISFPADAGQLRQALTNLIKNGLEAADGAGRVTVAARAAAGALEIEVSDTGPGLTDDQRAGLFVPGFTTKTRGSGLGLTIVERIVNDHQGSITVDSGATRGTTILLRLPLQPSTMIPGPQADSARI